MAESDRREVEELRSVVRLIDERRPLIHGELPAPSAEFLLFAVARLLDAIAAAIERGEPMPHDVRENAERIARHGLRYIDVYLPARE